MEKAGRKPSAGKRTLKGSFTVEAAGVMAAVLVTMMILVNQAFRLRAETVGSFQLHEAVERARHLPENTEKKTVELERTGREWSLEISSPVFRPENSLRIWSLAEDVS